MTVYVISTGIGVWGMNSTIGWAFDITNFVFWVGIGHAGTLISAILFLFRQKWRSSLNRFAEAMTLFAVMCAGLFVTIHLGRVWVFWYLVPAPSANRIFPNFRSPLSWDFAAVATYATVSTLFWYYGLIPTSPRCATGPRAGSGRGSTGSCARLAGLGAALAQLRDGLLDARRPGDALGRQRPHDRQLRLRHLGDPRLAHDDLPAVFRHGRDLLGAVDGDHADRALAGPLRPEGRGHERHLENMCKLILATGMLMGYGYLIEVAAAGYSGNPFEQYLVRNRMTGPYAWCYWTMIACNVVMPQLFWFRWFRTTPAAMFTIAVLVNVGMWFERFVIVVTSLSRDYLPSSWMMFYPTWVDLALLVGGFGLFATPFLLFIRFVPMVAISEVKACLPEADPHHAPPVREQPAGEPDAAEPPSTEPDGEGPVHGALASFGGPADLLAAADVSARPDTVGSTPTRRSPSTAWTGRWDCDARSSRCSRSPGDSSDWRSPRRSSGTRAPWPIR